LAGDEILQIASTATTDAYTARDLIIGPPGTFLEIVIRRGGVIKEFSVQRLRPCCVAAVRQDRVIRKLVNGLLDTSKKTCFELWLQFVDDAKECRRVLKRTAARILHFKMAAALLSWRTMVSELHQSRDIARQIILRLKSAKVSAAYATLSDHVIDMKKARESAKRVACRFMNKLKSMSFDSWSATTCQTRRYRAALSRAAAKWRNKYQIAAFNSWAEAVTALRDAAARARLVEIEAKNAQYRKECVMRRVTKHWKSRALSKMFSAWCYKKDAAVRVRWLCKRTVLRILHMRLGRAFCVWQEKVYESLRYKVSSPVYAFNYCATSNHSNGTLSLLLRRFSRLISCARSVSYTSPLHAWGEPN
jgi:hypothetical protein